MVCGKLHAETNQDATQAVIYTYMAAYLLYVTGRRALRAIRGLWGSLS